MKKKAIKRCKRKTRKWYHTIGFVNRYGYHFTESYETYLKDVERGLL